MILLSEFLNTASGSVRGSVRTVDYAPNVFFPAEVVVPLVMGSEVVTTRDTSGVD